MLAAKYLPALAEILGMVTTKARAQPRQGAGSKRNGDAIQNLNARSNVLMDTLEVRQPPSNPEGGNSHQT
jgi:hypothetical protein